MPNRIIREAWIDSERINRLTTRARDGTRPATDNPMMRIEPAIGRLAELLFLRLVVLADDYGRMDGRLSVICRKGWPLGEPGDPDEAELLEALQLIIRERLVLPYEVDGRPYLAIPRTRQRTRSLSKYPPPPADLDPELSTENIPEEARKAGKWASPGGHVTDSRQTSAGGSSVFRIRVGAADGQVTDKRRTKSRKDPTKAAATAPPDGKTASQLLRDAAAAERRRLEREAKAHQVAAPIPISDSEADAIPDEPVAVPVDNFTAPPGNGSNPRASPDLDSQAAALGMERLEFESDPELQRRITARMSL